MKKNLYEVLGVSATATAEEINAAFRKLAKQYHPDVCKDPDAEKRFKEISAANEVLSDPNKRAMYDQGGQRNDFPFRENVNVNDFDMRDFMNGFFGNRRRHSRKNQIPGEDVVGHVSISFQESFSGVQKRVSYNKKMRCQNCKGTGSSDGQLHVCKICRGTGEIHRVQETPIGTVNMVSTCPRCGGSGRSFEHPCKACDGSGMIDQKTEMMVTIPAGIIDGMVLRMSGQGSQSPTSNVYGDLRIVVEVRNDERFQRSGNDVHSIIELTMIQAALGCQVSVTMVGGEVKSVDFPAGTQSGQQKIFPYEGFPVAPGASRKGIHVAHVKVNIPTKLTDKQKKLLEEFDQS